LLETDLSAEEFVNFFGCSKFYSELCLVYDIGNAAHSKHCITRDIKLLGNTIKHVHIKDKAVDGLNVPLSTGIVDFPDFVKDIVQLGYMGKFTLETDRGENAFFQARKNLDYFQSLYK
jgi:sugar phosphate isomerase/epimerase